MKIIPKISKRVGFSFVLLMRVQWGRISRIRCL